MPRSVLHCALADPERSRIEPGRIRWAHAGMMSMYGRRHLEEIHFQDRSARSGLIRITVSRPGGAAGDGRPVVKMYTEKKGAFFQKSSKNFVRSAQKRLFVEKVAKA